MPSALKQKSKVASGRRIGRMARIFDEQDTLRLLRAAVEREGNQSAFARRYGVHRVSINLILTGKRPVSEAIKNALGLRRTYTDAE
jgi:ActR/RegA family two-component response regulator